MSREIPLTRGKFAIVDDEDYGYLMQWKWQCDNRGYARRQSSKMINGKRPDIMMHRLIVDAPPEMLVDHANQNPLDNRRANLRLANRGQNSANSGARPNSTSQYKGVSWNKSKRKWIAQIRNGGTSQSLGQFSSEVEAAKAYDEASAKLWGEFAYLNFPEGVEA